VAVKNALCVWHGTLHIQPQGVPAHASQMSQKNTSVFRIKEPLIRDANAPSTKNQYTAWDIMIPMEQTAGMIRL
jgi:hypothetical protein